jgi:hypothetical protein
VEKEQSEQEKRKEEQDKGVRELKDLDLKSDSCIHLPP